MKDKSVIIIGGGIAGAGVAAAIADTCSVVILEQEARAGYHSTGRSAATYIESYGNAVIQVLNRQSRPFFSKPAGISGGSLLRPRGMLLIASENDSSEIEELLASTDAVVELSVADSLSLIPILRKDGFTRAVYEEGASDIDVDRLHQGWLRLASDRGAQLELHSAVTNLHRNGDSWHVSTDTGTYQADIVVNASGAWADSIAKLAGVGSQSLTPKRRSAALVQLTSNVDVERWPLFADFNETWYAKPDAGRLLVSPADEDPITACDAWVDDLVLAGGIDRFEGAVTESVKRVEHSWAGLRTFAPDKTPVVGFDPDVDGFFWLAGHGGYGIQTSPALSQFAADLLLGKTVDSELRAGLSPARQR